MKAAVATIRDPAIPLYTALAMIAFASNSLLNRLALGSESIDAVSYTTVRLVTGAVVLMLIAQLQRGNGQAKVRGSWLSAALLFLYAVSFSFAYVSLSAGTGALILFGTVQVTMILAALRSGERPHVLVWLGILLALGGLIYLVMPGLEAPAPLGSALMTLAGIAWGGYSLRGRGSAAPLADTAGNFLYAVPFIVSVRLFPTDNFHLSMSGILLAAISGAIASGVGYVIWYAALRGLTATSAAIVQLSVPVLAAWGGVILLAEDVSLRLILAGSFILGGIALAVKGRVNA
ncbi:MAG TPA: DMT family transporter [Anaerolineales bacterium]|nr:DMT family transporter [Anaerolineales bacterium]